MDNIPSSIDDIRRGIELLGNGRAFPRPIGEVWNIEGNGNAVVSIQPNNDGAFIWLYRQDSPTEFTHTGLVFSVDSLVQLRDLLNNAIEVCNGVSHGL